MDWLEHLVREATNCRECFAKPEFGVHSAAVDVAQPRWIGPQYWSSKPRVAILLLNPGSGEGRSSKEPERVLTEMLRNFAKGGGTLAAIFEHERADMPNWGIRQGRFMKFYLDGLNLELDEVAFANVAWCSTAGNRYPPDM